MDVTDGVGNNSKCVVDVCAAALAVLGVLRVLGFGFRVSGFDFVCVVGSSVCRSVGICGAHGSCAAASYLWHRIPVYIRLLLHVCCWHADT